VNTRRMTDLKPAVLAVLAALGTTIAVSGCTMIGSEELTGPRPPVPESARPGPLSAPERGSEPTRPATTPESGSNPGESPEIERLLAIRELTREAEPPSRGGNRSQYEQWGETYEVLETSEGYDERGVASWYGEPFHGRQTSSGEVYDMYELTAAHRSLPLPTYVEVTNLANGRSVVLRVTDRGPFHDPDRRIIDVSYTAALQLGMVGTGTAPVRVRAVEPYQTRVAR
jgi:peptidoglycan lytic transglycosylase